MCFSTVSQRGRFRFRVRFLENGSGGSGSPFGSWENGSDGSGFRFRPNLLFLAFLDFLAFFFREEFLAFLSVFPFFPRNFKGSKERKNPCFFGGFPCLFPKTQGKEDQGGSVPGPPCNVRIGAVLSWKLRILWSQLQFFSRCCVGFMFSEYNALTTHAPSIKGVRFHPLIRGWGPEKTVKQVVSDTPPP